MWTIGQLAQATRTTVRALRHYDQIGLLRPTERTQNGHRRYGPDDLRRLYRIRALRTFGLSLDDIAAALEAPASMTIAPARPPGGPVAARVRDRGPPDAAHPAARPRRPDRLSESPGDDGHARLLFHPEQQDSLAARRADLGPEAVERAKGEWLTLVGVPPRVRADRPGPRLAARARALVARWDAMGAVFHTGGTGTEAATRRMWAENSEETERPPAVERRRHARPGGLRERGPRLTSASTENVRGRERGVGRRR